MSGSILDVMHETDKGLHKVGLMDTITMRKIDELWLPEVKK